VTGNSGQARHDHNRGPVTGVIKSSGEGVTVVLTTARMTTAAVGAATLMVLAACGGHGPGAPTATIQPTTVDGPDPVPVRITQVVLGQANPVEGYVSYLRVEPAHGAAVITGRLPGSQRVTLRLPPGRYRLRSWQRTCDGNCSYLDQPTIECARAFTLHRGEPLAATIQVDWTSGCTVVLGPG
jgi:hypothetical protein